MIVFVDILFLNLGNGFYLVFFECFIFVNIFFYILIYLKILFVCWSGCINEILIFWYEKRENMMYCLVYRLFVNVIDYVDLFNENKSINELDFNFCFVY